MRVVDGLLDCIDLTQLDVQGTIGSNLVQSFIRLHLNFLISFFLLLDTNNIGQVLKNRQDNFLKKTARFLDLAVLIDEQVLF
jgi:hypothetical protein